MRRTFLLLVLLICVLAAGLVYLHGGLGEALSAPGPTSPERAIIEASREEPGDANLGVLFRQLNARHFDGRLPAAKVLWSERLDRLDVGDYRLNGMTDGTIILLKSALQNDDAEVRRTLCHEMVHVQLFSGGQTSTAHDAAFQNELRRVFDSGCFEATWAPAEEKAALGEWIAAERARLDAAHAQVNAQGESIKAETARVEQLVAELNERITAANAAGSGGPSAEEVADAERQRTALNDSILAYNSAVAANNRDRDTFNDAVQRHNLMLAYPDGLAEDRAKGLIR